MKFKRWLIPLIVTVAGSFMSAAQVYTFKNFNYKEGLSLVSILTAEESDDGYLWFGTDGAGLMRYDGKVFNSLGEEQGRNNRHVNSIFFHENKVLFSTMYRGVYYLENKKINRLPFIDKTESRQAIFNHHNNYVVLQDRGLKILQDSSLIYEKKNPADSHNFNFYGSCNLGEELLIFSSNMDYCVKKDTALEIHKWLGLDEILFSNYVLAYKESDSLFLIDKYLYKTLSMPLDDLRNENAVVKKSKESFLTEEEEVIKWHRRGDVIAIITNKGRVLIYDIPSSELRLISSNSDQMIDGPTDIIVDRNMDIWVTSSINGVYRISLEPFTDLKNNELFNEPHISFVAKTKEGDLIITVGVKGTFIGEGTKESNFKKYNDVFIRSMTVLDGNYLVSTRNGVYQIVDKKLEYYAPLSNLKGQRISLIINAFDYLWYSIEGKGLFRKSLTTGKVTGFSTASNYFYSGIVSKDSTAIYFGSNVGVLKFDRAEDKLKSISRKINGEFIGSYVGNSVIDSFGTIWFSLDEGLLGIKENGERVSITAENILPSLLIYTLNSDKYGNLIIGSNKGVTVVRVSKNGEPLSSRTYDMENGFYGYETHMRTSFQSPDGSILLGTLSGLVLVRPEFFEKEHRLNKPIIKSLKDKNIEKLIDRKKLISLNSEDNNVLIEFKSINTKSNFVTYKYRLKGGEEKFDKWTVWSPKQEAIFNNLSAGSYVFEVKSSIDGANVSEINSLSFNIVIPFYKNKWFIIIVIGLVVLVNTLILDRSSNFNKKNIILSRDIVADRSIAKNILVFGAVANTLGHTFAPRVDETLNIHDFSAITFGLIVLALYFMITFIDRKLKKTRVYLALGFLVLLGYNLAYTYLSDIHPFYFVATLLVTFVAPYTLEKLRSAVLVGLALGILSVVIIFLVDEAKFNQYLFLMGIALACFLMIFKSYLRNNSLEQLIFTSGIVNKGNALVVAFDKKGKISYASENIEVLLGMTKSLKGENVLFLNDYQPSFNEMKSFSDDDLINKFKEGSIFVTPLITDKNEVVFYQWSCKQFSDELRVILGQDVTEKINLENYYELIVRNADDLIFQTDTKGNFTFVNEKCCDVLGRTKIELLNLSIISFVEPVFQKRVSKFFEKNIQNRNKGGYREFPIVNPKEEMKWLGLNLTQMKKPGSENVVTGFLGLARDITSTRKANAIIKEQNRDITSSINYARRIQFNMLPISSDFENLFEEHFVFYQPKDIVSGDFFWLKEVDDKTILILSDCTGHGVPGSFMTLLGINILDQIILEAKISDPGEILNQLDIRLKEVLPRDGENRIQDGMEVVVCVFDKRSDKVEYAFAGGRFVIKDNENESVEVIKGQIKHIGDLARIDNFSYKTENLLLEEHQILYLFSDGYPDQFGGGINKKLTIKKFLSLLDDTSKKPVKNQSKIFERFFRNWIGNLPQTDDITVVGVRGRKK